MFHQVRVRLKDTDALRFLWRANPQDDIKDYVMLAQIFGKVDSPSCANWLLRKTTLRIYQMSNKQSKGTFTCTTF